MKFKIHGETKDGKDDYVVIEGETIEKIRTKAESEVKKRDWMNPWSEEIK